MIWGYHYFWKYPYDPVHDPLENRHFDPKDGGLENHLTFSSRGDFEVKNVSR